VAVLIFAVTAFAAPKASADNGPHTSGLGVDTDGCASCHRVHRGVNDTLNLAAVADICLTCHGNGAPGSILNVSAGTSEGTGAGAGALRAGGFEFARINTADPSLPIPRFPAGSTSSADNDNGVSVCYADGIDQDGDGVADDGCRPHINALAAPGGATQSSHSVDGSLQTIWGNGAISGVANPGLAGYDLECGKCHDPHGNGNYRILRTIPDGSGGAGYAIPDTYPKDEDAGDYATTNYFDMTFTGDEATDEILKDTAAWCAQCHTRYLATRRDPAGAAYQSRVDSGDAIFTFRHTSSGQSYSSSGVASNVNRACITCHATHGSNAIAGTDSGAVPDPAGVAGTGAANSKLLKMNYRGMCQKCHNK
jgi:predicted CXXCH cytochrome family protein